jgi:hypothetical protein
MLPDVAILRSTKAMKAVNRRVSCPQNYEISCPFTGYLATGIVSKIIYQVP